MRRAEAEDVYNLFETFIEDFLINRDSILTDDEGILELEDVEECLKRYYENYDDSSSSFDQKVLEQFEGATDNQKLIFAHAEWLWAFAVDDISKGKKRYYAQRLLDSRYHDNIKDVYPVGFGSAGQWHTNNKYYEILFNLKCFQAIIKAIDDEIIEAEVGEIYKWFETACLFTKNVPVTESKFEPSLELFADFGQLAQANIILHVAFPYQYERIASNNHKRQIAHGFESLIPEERKEGDLHTDERILIIRNELERILEVPGDEIDFYQERFMRVWNYSLTDEGYDEIQGLQYKKAIILYGPPGTSKTHSARRLAESLITNDYLKDKSNVIKFFKEEEDYLSDRIHILQLHPNYTYEDFVAGYQLKNHETIPVKGTLFNICDDTASDSDKPHVLILDEINRIDLSRLFGEVFSALENRDTPIQLSIGGFELSIPKNLYVIGTMNEIDFSLERIDFALRRRFLWFFYGYHANTLWNIIAHKNDTLKTRLRMGEEMERFVHNATALNQKISSIAELGEQYQIGHTFFSEIVDIYKGYKEIEGYKQLRYQLYRKDGPTKILWDISIEPMLVSFLGNMDTDSRDNILNELKAIYQQE